LFTLTVLQNCLADLFVRTQALSNRMPTASLPVHSAFDNNVGTNTSNNNSTNQNNQNNQNSSNATADAFDALNEDQVSAILHLYQESRRHNDSKLFSMNKVVQESLPNLVAGLQVVVKNGPQWLRLTFKEATQDKPLRMTTEGNLEILIPQKCLRDSRGYPGEVSAHILEEEIQMVCEDGTVKFPTIEEQKAEQAALQAVVTNEGFSRFFQEQSQQQQQRTESLKQRKKSNAGSSSSNNNNDNNRNNSNNNGNNSNDNTNNTNSTSTDAAFTLPNSGGQQNNNNNLMLGTNAAFSTTVTTTATLGTGFNSKQHNGRNSLVEQDNPIVPNYISNNGGGTQGEGQVGGSGGVFSSSLSSSWLGSSSALAQQQQHNNYHHNTQRAYPDKPLGLDVNAPIADTPSKLRAFSAEYEHRQAARHTEMDRLNALRPVLPDDELIKRYGRVVRSQMNRYVPLFGLLVMIKSCMDHLVDLDRVEYGECPFDDGGHLIAPSGSEKVLMLQETTRYNIILVFMKRDQNYVYAAQCRSQHLNDCRSTSTLDMYYMNRASTSVEGSPILIHQSNNLDNIPWVIMIRALGIESAEEMRTLYRFVIGPDKCTPFHMQILERCIEDDRGCRTTREAVLRIGKLVNAKTESEQEAMGLLKLRNDILPHLNSQRLHLEEFMKQDFFIKAVFLCRMAGRLIEAVEHAPEYDNGPDNPFLTDRDSYFSKRVETSNELLMPLIRQYLHKHLNRFVGTNIRKLIRQKKPINLYEIFSKEKITKGIGSNISTGTWHAEAGRKSKTGVSQNVERFNFTSQLAQHRKLINQIHKEGKYIGPRLMPNTAIGKVCSVHTPEGPSCGLARNEAIMNRVSVGSPPDTIIQLLYNSKLVRAYHQVNVLDVTELGFHEWQAQQQQQQGVAKSTERSNNTSNNNTGNNSNDNGNNNNNSTNNSNSTSDNRATQNQEADWMKSNPNQSCPTVAPPFVHVYVNQKPIGIAADGLAVMQFVRDKRRKQTISAETSVARELQGHNIEICTEACRMGSDRFVVENMHKIKELDLSAVNYRYLRQQGIVEYIDTDEEREVTIAITSEELGSSIIEWQQKHPNEPYPASLATQTYSHAELHGCVIYGICGNMIPFCDHNPPARNNFQSHMGAQAQGQPSTNSKQKFDNSFTELWYAERPLVNTEFADQVGSFRLPAGHNLNIAIYADDNEEDSFVICKDIVDAGYLCSSYYKTTTITEKRFGKGNKKETFALVPPQYCTGYKLACDYSKLDENGIIKINERVTGDTILAQKVIPRDLDVPLHSSNSASNSSSSSTTNSKAAGASGSSHKNSRGKAAGLNSGSNGSSSSSTGGNAHNNNDVVDSNLAAHSIDVPFRDNSVPNRGNELGYVDDRYMYGSENSISTGLKLRIRYPRIPQEGDKYATRHGQKGTGAMFAYRERLPYDPITGEVPDILMNGLAFSSRMTFAQYVSAVFALVCCLNGRFGIATPFGRKFRDALYATLYERNKYFIEHNNPLEEIGDALRALGYHPYASRSLIDGDSGERMTCNVFMAPEFVQKLKHMVADKARARGRGNTAGLSQPMSENQKKDPAQKIGEMEKDVLVGTGTSALAHDKLCFSADACYVTICKLCKQPSINHHQADLNYCKNCNKKNTSTNNLTPSSLLLFHDESQAIGLDMKLHTQELPRVY
jgi:DNA-directed RNA polymerase beta subunit